MRITNSFDDCVNLDLDWGPRDGSDLAILFRINFSTERREVLGGHITFGVRGGVLRLSLRNADLPYDRRWGRITLPLSQQVERSISYTEKKTQAREAGLHARLGGSEGAIQASTGGSIKRSTTEESENSLTDEFSLNISQISTKGSSDFPAWQFQTRFGDPYLSGEIPKRMLGQLTITGPTCRCEAKFIVPGPDLVLTQVEGLYPQSLTSNKRGVVRLMVLKMLRRRAGELFSYGALEYESKTA